MMRPMSPCRWRLFAFTPVPLLALVLLGWARSYLPEESYCRPVDGRLLLFFVNGENAQRFEPGNPQFRGARMEWDDLRASRLNDINFWCLGIEVFGTRDLYPAHFVVAVPFGWLALPLAAASAWWAVGYRRRRIRERTGCCRQCGYDLRGSPGRCPECGNEEPASQERAAGADAGVPHSGQRAGVARRS